MANIVGNVLLAVPGIIIAIFSGITAWIAAPQSDEGWVRWFLIVMVMSSMTWALSAWGALMWRRFRSLPRPPSAPAWPPPPSDEPAKRVVGGGQPPPVKFLIEGDWGNSPFEYGFVGEGEHAEDAYLTITANTFLENVRIQIIAFATSDPKDHREYWHGGNFQGSVTAEMTERIRLFRRTYCIENVAFRNINGSHTHTRMRRDMRAILFDGTPAETKAMTEVISIKVVVHHKGGKIQANLGIDTGYDYSPRSRLFSNDGSVQIMVSDRHRPFGADVIYR